MKTLTQARIEAAGAMFLALVLMSIGVLTHAATTSAPPGLFKPSHVPAHVNLPPQAMAGRSRFAAADLGRLNAPVLHLNLFDDTRYTARRTRWVEGERGQRVWVGELDGVADSEVTLAAVGRALAGTVRAGQRLYAIRYSGSGVQSISEVRGSDPLPELDPLAFETTSGTGETSTSTTSSTGTGPVIDVMVLYTPAARQRQGGVDGIEALVALAVEETNQAYLNSAIEPRLRLAHTAEVAYAESGDMQTDLRRLTYVSDGYLDDVHAWRDAYGADLVSLIEEANQYCGIAWQMSEASNSFHTGAFSVVASQCATGYFSFGHELGHNMGLAHDRLNASSTGATDYAYGYQSPEALFRTVMAYDCSSGCTRVQHFSNAAVAYEGDPTGVDYFLDPANAAENARTLNETAQVVAGFRSAPVTEPPVAPSGLQAHATDVDRIELSWSDNADTESGFRLERARVGGTFVEIADLAKNSTTYLDSGLESATSYSYRVLAYNSAGESAYSTEAGAATLDPASFEGVLADGEEAVASSPSGDYTLTFAADGVAETLVEIESKGKPSGRYGYLEHRWTFQVPSNSGLSLVADLGVQVGASGERFRLAYAVNGGGFTELASVGADSASPLTVDLPAGTSGSLTLRVTDTQRLEGVNTRHSLSVDRLALRAETASGGLPIAPSGLSAEAVSSSEIGLSWTDNATDEQGYRIETSLDGQSWSWLANVASDVTSYVHGGLGAGSQHQYRVQAFNDAGASEFAGPASAVTFDSAGIQLTVYGGKVKGAAQAELAWTGTAAATVDIYRNGSMLIAGEPDGGAYLDVLGKRIKGDFSYRVCEGGSDTLCSAAVGVSF